MSEFKSMVKMYTDEPKVSLKLKKGGKVHHKKHHKEHEEHGHKNMQHHAHGGMHHAFESEHGKSPKKPSMSERMKAMNPTYKKGGKVAHKAIGGNMPVQAPMQAMGQQALGQMSPQARMARALAVKKALGGMKKGGEVDHKHIEKLEKELHHHEKLDAKHAHPQRKATGGAIDKAETRTTIKKGANKFEKTKMNDGQHHDKHHGTGDIKEGKPAGYKHGGHAHKHHKATGGAIPADTHESKNKAKTKFGGTYEGNEHDYVNTEMHSAKKDKMHGTGGIHESNAGGYKHGGHAHKVHHKAKGGRTAGIGRAIEHDGDWENRPADTAHSGKKGGKTGEVKESNAGGYKHGGHASKKHYATGGNVVDSGKAEKMPRHFVSRPVANSLQSGTFKKGGKVDKEEKPNLRLVKTHTGPKGHVAKVYKDRDWGEHRVKFYSPEGKHHTESDYHTDDVEDAHDTAMHQLNRYKHGGKTKRYAEGDSVVDDAQTRATNKANKNWEQNQREENEADANLIPNMVKRGVNAVKGMFGSKSPESVTKTEKSITVTPAKKRGGSARKR